MSYSTATSLKLTQEEFEENTRNEAERRIKLFLALSKSTAFQMREEEMCKRSFVHFCNNWLWTFDPRTETKTYPFRLHPFQEEAVRWLDDRYNNNEIGVIEKTRDMGATWIIASWSLHKFLFSKGFTCLFASRIQSDVDNGTIDSIIEKIRFNLYRLPDFMRPPMEKQITAGEGSRRRIDADAYLRLINPLNKNEIIGKSTNDNLGRGGRKSIVFLDEYAFVEHSDKIWSSVGEVSKCIIPYSTANGKGNQFYRLTQNKAMPKLTLHWKKHPLKNDQWYAEQEDKYEPHQLASEIDIDYMASKAGRIYKRADRRYHVASEIIYPNMALEQFMTWDFGIADMMITICGQITAMDDVEIYAAYGRSDYDIDYFLPMTQGRRPPDADWLLISEKERKTVNAFLRKVFQDPETGETNFLDFDHYGDFAGTQRSQSSRRSVKIRMEAPPYNINLQTCTDQTHANRIQCFDNLLKIKKRRDGSLASRFRVSPDVSLVIDALFNYVWDKEDVNSPTIKPKHDEFSHPMSALEFFAINRYPVKPEHQSSVERYR